MDKKQIWNKSFSPRFGMIFRIINYIVLYSVTHVFILMFNFNTLTFFHLSKCYYTFK
jgi:hypothetical protein